jgi:hypothetical protein
VADQFDSLSDQHQDFLSRQKIFFAGSAAPTGRVNISPRPTDVFRIIDPNRVAYLDYIGSGNETAAHTRLLPRMTIMTCAFEGPPRILRLYGTASTHQTGTDEFAALLAAHYDNTAPRNARQIVVLNFDMVQTSSGYGVPLFEYQADRPNLTRWADAKSAEELVDYRRIKNTTSIDGFDTGHIDGQ